MEKYDEILRKLDDIDRKLTILIMKKRKEVKENKNV